ncbi:fungal specific transcription factor domain-containing protein [Sarocladium implicatum]|nr:fungal specific transcription factor domain-containing protein [Sarocladium implicatum]
MASTESHSISSPGGYKRASRKGAPRRFVCEHAGCDKIYSRAEHLQRHQLNHNPKEIFRCDVPECDQKFVRPDLLARHKKRHTASYTPRNRVPSFSTLEQQTKRSSADDLPIDARSRPSAIPHYPPPPSGGPHDAAILLTPESNTATTPAAAPQSFPNRTNHLPPWTTSPAQERAPPPVIREKSNYYGSETSGMAEASNMLPFSTVSYAPSDHAMVQENFAAWLFDPQSTYNDFSLSSIPFLEAGLESTFNSNIQYDYDSLNGRSPLDPTPPQQTEQADDLITEMRRQEILQWFQTFRNKQPKYEPHIRNLVHESGGDIPGLNVEMMRDCLREFWESVSPRLPIVHQHTFSANRCPIFLLLAMVALGAASLAHRDSTGQLSEYSAFADVIVSSVRWEVLTADDSVPPVGLWVAQALLLVEFYEKLFSSRRFHERAHIYHPAFLTLLRRGSPLIGRAGSESPPESDNLGADRQSSGMALDSRTWWIRWADTESMHRVVFAAFMLDIVHAAMFGHAADMAAHEIRLPLPCDDNLWTANSPDLVRQLDSNFRMYGVKQVSFLDGLKSALHGKEVKTHSFGRMIILCGLLSVGWHLSRRETHLKWLDLRTPTADTQDNWRKVLLRAFDKWKDSFDIAMSDSVSDAPGQRGIPNGPINSASLLFHLAHMSLHADIVDCQVYSGARRLLGRKVSSRDYTNATKRMSAWAKQASTRHAVLHAFKLLYRVLVDPHPKRRSSHTPDSLTVHYSIRNEPDPHRPWIMFYAVLTIWAFVQALGRQPNGYPMRPHHSGHGTYVRMAQYLASVAELHELSEQDAMMLHEGLPDLLDVMEGILQEAATELLAEARERLKVCKEMLVGQVR